MTYRLRNVAIAVGLALVAMLLTLFYVSNYRRTVQHQQQSPAHHVAQRAVGLLPLPGFAQLARQLPPAPLRPIPDQPADESDLFAGDAASPIDHHDSSVPESVSERK